jgi:hypothetical protein
VQNPVFVVHMYLKHWRTPDVVLSGVLSFPQNPSGNSMLTAVA